MSDSDLDLSFCTERFSWRSPRQIGLIIRLALVCVTYGEHNLLQAIVSLGILQDLENVISGATTPGNS